MTSVTTVVVHGASTYVGQSRGLDYLPVLIIASVVGGVTVLYLVATRWRPYKT